MVCQTLLLDLDVGCRDVSVQKVGMKLAKETCTGDEIGLGLVDRLRLELDGLPVVPHCVHAAVRARVDLLPENRRGLRDNELISNSKALRSDLRS